MRYFLGKVKKNDQGIFIIQSKYTGEILTRFVMENFNMLYSLIVTRSKMKKDETGKTMYSTKYKKIVR